MFLSDEGPMLETLDYTIRIGSTPTILYFYRELSLYGHFLIFPPNTMERYARRANANTENVFYFLIIKLFLRRTSL